MQSKRPLFSDKFRFSRPKTPGYGIAQDFYLSALSPRPVLPAIIEIVNPKGEGGAVAGYGAPLSGKSDRSLLTSPLVRGAYAVASVDKKSVLRMLVMPKEEAGYDPESVLLHASNLGLLPEVISRLRATWMLMQFSFEAHDPSVAPSLDFLLRIVQRTAELVGGIVADPISGRFLLPEQLQHPNPENLAIDARNFVSIQNLESVNGRDVFTQGMRKFTLPELEISGVPDNLSRIGSLLLIGICQTTLTSEIVSQGARVGSEKSPFLVAHGGLDRSRWEGIPAFELIPETGTVADCLIAWATENDLI